jgi:hypothetical protein
MSKRVVLNRLSLGVCTLALVWQAGCIKKGPYSPFHPPPGTTPIVASGGFVSTGVGSMSFVSLTVWNCSGIYCVTQPTNALANIGADGLAKWGGDTAISTGWRVALAPVSGGVTPSAEPLILCATSSNKPTDKNIQCSSSAAPYVLLQAPAGKSLVQGFGNWVRYSDPSCTGCQTAKTVTINLGGSTPSPQQYTCTTDACTIYLY